MDAFKRPSLYVGIGFFYFAGLMFAKYCKKPAAQMFTVPKEGGVLQRLEKDEDGFISLVLTEKIKITHDTFIFRFGFPRPD